MSRRYSHWHGLVGVISVAVMTAVQGRWDVTRAQEPTFRGRADSVSVDVSVRRAGRPVGDLLAADFELLDNGVPQQVSGVSYEKLPIDVTVALDVSGSVSGATLDQLRRSMAQLKADLSAADRLKLLTFNMRVAALVDFDAPVGRVDAALGAITPQGSSAIFDALALALTAPTSPDRRQLIVLFTDGQDSSSVVDPGALLEIVRRTTPAVAIVLATGASAALRFQAPLSSIDAAFRRVYDRVAAETGGLAVQVPRNQNLSSTFRRVLEEFRSSYVLHFTPQGVERSGFHTLAVRVKRPEPIEIRARTGYTVR